MSAVLLLAILSGPAALPPGADDLVPGGGVAVDTERGEIRFPATVQYPRGKPCIDAWGQRIQAFLGCARSGGAPSEFADHFVFLAGVDTDEVYRGLVEVGA